MNYKKSSSSNKKISDNPSSQRLVSSLEMESKQFLRKIDNDFEIFKDDFFKKNPIAINDGKFEKYKVICNCWIPNTGKNNGLIQSVYEILDDYWNLAKCVKRKFNLFLFQKEVDMKENLKNGYLTK